MQSGILIEIGHLGSVTVDALAAVVLIKILHPVKHAIFLAELGLHKLLSSDRWPFSKFCKDSRGEKTQLVILNAIVVSSTHFNKTVTCLGEGTYAKGENVLLA